MKRALVLICSVGLLLTGIATANATARAPHALVKSPIPKGLHAKRVCAPTAVGVARCLSFVLVDRHGRTFTSPAPAGLGPADFQDAYKLPSSTNGKGMTIALVDAYHDPNAESDLAVYRSTFGLPACTSNNGCFKQVDANGGTNWPRTNNLWALETSLDVDMVSAICPKCNILLVEAYGGWIGGLGKAVNTAVKLGAVAVSNSYENRTKPRDLQLDEKYYNHPGVAITVASGDAGYNNFRQFPASSQYVIAVGGTYLKKDGSKRGWAETVWSGSGSECALYDAKPAWQTDTDCAMRTVADVSADASPASGAAVYDTFGQGGWIVVGGTSEASPIIAAVFGLAGDKVTYAERLYKNPNKLFDVTTGTNGSCGGSYLCTGGAGYDGPTGLGTPNGIGDF